VSITTMLYNYRSDMLSYINLIPVKGLGRLIY